MIKIRKLKLMPLVLAAVLLVAGIVVLAVSYGGVSDSALAILVGTLILGIGTTRLVYGFLTYTEELDARNNITLGVLDAVWSILMLVLNNNPFAFVLLFALWCLIAAVLEIIEIVKNVLAKKPYLHLLADTILNVVFGIIALIGKDGGDSGTFSLVVGVYLVLNAFASGLVTVLSIPGIKLGHKELVPAGETAPVEAAPVEEEKVEETPVETTEAPVEAPAKKPAAKKTTTTKKTTATKSTSAKTTATKTTTAKTTAAKKPAAKKTTPKADA